MLCAVTERTDPRLSPDERRIAFLAPINGTLNLWVADVENLDEAVPLTQVNGTGLRPNHGWSYDGQHVLYALDENDDEQFHVYAVHVGTAATRDLTEEFLLSRSPVTRTSELRTPLLLVQGENDPRCPVTEAEQPITELRSRGIPYTYVVVADEGQGFLRPENNIRLLGWIEDFLGEHLSSSVPASPERWG